uniref:Uncharacterized protein n=1 Tax=Nelumbo nucifera TaxID=4432 RepID=A0A822ZW29_NELNU|nr:TPA_asm: hypothetical protein HUJ06_017472 [Nelumbo nucifera]
MVMSVLSISLFLESKHILDNDNLNLHPTCVSCIWVVGNLFLQFNEGCLRSPIQCYYKFFLVKQCCN